MRGVLRAQPPPVPDRSKGSLRKTPDDVLHSDCKGKSEADKPSPWVMGGRNKPRH